MDEKTISFPDGGMVAGDSLVHKRMEWEAEQHAKCRVQIDDKDALIRRLVEALQFVDTNAGNWMTLDQCYPVVTKALEVAAEQGFE